MPLKVLVDENLPRRLAAFLKANGFETKDVRDVGLKGASDRNILAWAAQHEFLILTGDVGFASVKRFPPNHFGIMVLRGCKDLTLERTMEVVLQCLRAISKEELQGKIFICEPGRVRIRS